MESAGDVTDLSNRFIDQARKVVKFLGVPRAFAVKITREGGERGSQDMLAQVVMHFAADPALLSFSGIEKGVLGLHSVTSLIRSCRPPLDEDEHVQTSTQMV